MIVFHYDPATLNEWLHLLQLFRVPGRVIGYPEGKAMHRLIRAIDLQELSQYEVVRVIRTGEKTLSCVRDDAPTAYVFGPDHRDWVTPDSMRANRTMRIATPVDEDMYAHQSAAILMWAKFGG